MTTLNFMLVVEDGGELKTVSSVEIDAWCGRQVDENGNTSQLAAQLNEALNSILDEKAIAAGDYDPSDNDTPIAVMVSGHYTPFTLTKVGE